jgi:hypothetical protein
MRLALRGAAIVFALGFLAFAVSAYGMDFFRYSEWSVALFRIFAYLAMLGLAVRFLVLLPLFRRVSDEQVALYIEEHNPELQQAVISAVEAGADKEGKGVTLVSQELIEKLVDSAVEQCESMDEGRGIEQRRLQKASGALALFAAFGMLAVVLGPSFLRHGGSLLLKPWRNAQAANPYFVTVEPGNIGVARGADQMVEAQLGGFDSDRVEVAVKTGDNPDWQRWPMTLEEATGEYGFMLFDLQEPTHYFVEASGVRSDIFRIDVSDLPFVEKIDLEYYFPEYAGLESRLVEDGGDIAALEGTHVELTITPTVRVAGGRLLIEGEEPIPLDLKDNATLTGAFDVERDGFYKVELEGFDGKMHDASPDYIIEVLTDQPPSITVTKPGRDSKVTSIEEVFTEIKADDDYGVGRVELVYSVNGGPDQQKMLYRNEASPKKEITAGHTFFLEDFELEPGDFISYFAKATDTDRVAGTHTATSDIYFIEVRPFGKDYRQSQQRGGGGGGGGGADGALSLRQRQIVAATFKLIRDKDEYDRKEYNENLTTIALMQGRLREQTENLLRRMSNRGITDQESDFGKISTSLRLAIDEMGPAEEKLMEGNPSDALPPEQRALQHLQRAESTFRDVQVTFGGGGGGGGGEQSNAEDLADLFELELDKLRNQYETVERGAKQSAGNQIDEALQRLQELARRQQQENERMKRRAGTPQGGGRGSGSQRELAEETEELARKLERLAREQSQPDLMDTARRLREAAEAMRRGASGGKQGNVAEGIAALDQLKDARRLLEKNREVRLEQGIQDVSDRARRLAAQQDKVLSDVRKLDQEGGAGRAEKLERLLERKDEMATEVADLEAQLDRMARESRSEQKDASRKLQEAANSIRDNKLKEKIRYSKGVVQGRSGEYAEQFEEQVRADLENLQDRIRQAAGAVGQSDEARVADAIDKTRDLVQNLESLGDRIRERREESRRLAREDRNQEGQNQEGQGEEGQSSSESGQTEGEGQSQGRQRGEPSQTGQPSREPGAGGSAGSQDGRNFQPGTFSTEDIRQWRREFRERVQEAEGLREELRRQDLQVPDLKDIIARMKEFDQKKIYMDPLGFDELQADLLEELKQFEYWLRRELEGIGKEKLFLAGSDQVPSEYRKLVEEYYRSLSRTPSKKK